MDSNEVRDQHTHTHTDVGSCSVQKEKQTKISGEPRRMKRKVRQSNINVDVFFFSCFFLLSLLNVIFKRLANLSHCVVTCDLNEQKN